MLDGAKVAGFILQKVRGQVELLPDAERIQWWAGFLGAAFGASRASIGTEASRVLAECLPPVADDALRGTTN